MKGEIYMIRYDRARRLLVLDNGSIGYVIYVNDAGYLETVYFGKHLADYSDFDCVRRSGEFATPRYRVEEGREVGYADGFKLDASPLEVSSHGLSDKRGAPIVVRGADGSFVTDLRYRSHRRIMGVPAPEGLPHAHGAAETADILLEDRALRVRAHLYLTIFPDKDVLVKSFRIENVGKKPVRLTRAMSMQLDLPRSDYDLVHFHGRWAKERDYCCNRVVEGVQEVSSNLGRSSAESNPFVYLKQQGATTDHGEVIGFNLIYSGNFKFRTYKHFLGWMHITYGINDEDFEWTLSPGETFATPQAVIAYSAEGTDKMSQTFHRFIRENLMTYEKNEEYKPVLFNSWEGCYMTFDTQLILSYIDDACKIGTELFVLDDGWFGARDTDRAGLGDWTVNKGKIDLHRVIAHCRERGLKFGIWFEPEMVNPDSDLFRAHPEYALGWGSKELSLARHQLHLDFANPEVVENIYAQMKSFLEEYRVDYIKWDYNRTVAEHVSAAYPPERQGEIYHRLMLGYYSLLGRLVREYPDIMFEGCASGGGRFDMGTLYYCPQIWCSDESNPAQRIDIQFNTSLGYPLSCIGSHVNDSNVASYSAKAALALFGTYGYEMNPNKLTPEEMGELAATADIYRKYHHDVIANGTLYHLYAPYEGNYMCMQCVSRDRGASLVLFMNKLKEQDRFRFVRLKGLDAKKRYRNTLDDKVHTGEYYMCIGLNLSRYWPTEFSHRLILLTEEK